MSYGCLDDGWHEDPRVLDVGLTAAGLYACANCYVARHLLDGVIPKKAIERLLAGRDTEPLDALLDVGLLVESKGGFELPDYFDNGNETREKVLKRRRDAKARKDRALNRWREKRAKEQDGEPDA
jgi:hypothetical protein